MGRTHRGYQRAQSGKAFPSIQETVEGRVVGAEVEDLNSYGLPDLFVYVQSAASGSYGSVKAWTTTRAGGLLPIHLQDMSAKDAKGYMGYDQFAVVETSLVRRFPVYRSSDKQGQPHRWHLPGGVQAGARRGDVATQAGAFHPVLSGTSPATSAPP
jgi:hypothetical protein